MQTSSFDVVIFGAGISGLWTYNCLKEKGYNICLLVNNTYGGQQSLASQGMIHGGQRYALQGNKNNHSESISDMPQVWQNCIDGNKTPDLSGVNILSDKQYMWSPGGLSSSVTAFFASKAMNSKVNALSKSELPKVFSDNFKGKAYQLNEQVLDIQSVSQKLFSNFPNSIYKFDRVDYEISDKGIESIGLNESIEVKASTYIFTAGKGNEEIAQLLSPDKKITQRRPLKQVLVKEVEYDLYAHCITTDPRPRVTVSAHPLSNGNFVWYLGGLVAVKHIKDQDSKAIEFAYSELSKLFPQINWKEKQWAALSVDRAEPYAKTGLLPDGPKITQLKNAILGWPTKLTFAPLLASGIQRLLETLQIEYSNDTTELNLSAPELGQFPWDNIKWQNI